MVKLLTAHTLEADELEVALAEILEQLDMDNNCLKNTAGFLFCHPDFISTGVAQGIAKFLPFEVIGATTVCSLTQGLRDFTGLSVSVITSDTVEFSAASLSFCHTAEDVAKIYQEAAHGRSGSPSLILPLAAITVGDTLVNALDALTNSQTPIFGSIAVGSTSDVSKTVVLHNKTVLNEGLAIIAVWGEIKTEFFISEIKKNSVQEKPAVITKSDGNIVHSINNTSVLEYLESIGISRDQAENNLQAIPFIVDMLDGAAPVARGFFGLNADGNLIASGSLPENSTIAAGTLDSDDVIRVTANTIENALSCDKSKGILIFPCVSHFWVMESTPFTIIQDKIDNVIPYQVFYSGGEICPVHDSNGKLYNRFHNFTCIACSFE